MRKIICITIGMFFMFGINSVEAQCCENGHKGNSGKNTEIKNEINVVDSLLFKVSGNCGMCMTRIENAAKSIKGVSKAVWKSETGMLKVTLSKQVNVHEIHKAIAKAGHDTELHKADNAVYNKLPTCCKYNR